MLQGQDGGSDVGATSVSISITVGSTRLEQPGVAATLVRTPQDLEMEEVIY